ncbi:MAG: hypothetical protein HC902_04675 [Calothrix sp. SM1_5_4]|nr:hypothetical protein [Calothrix sp. SM1_5_4]
MYVRHPPHVISTMKHIFTVVIAAMAVSFSTSAEESVRKSPSEIQKSIYTPWSAPLSDLERLIAPKRDYVFWIHVPARHHLDLRSSDHFRQWTLATPTNEMSISHNMIAFRCRDRQGRLRQGATGMSGGSSHDQEKKMILGGYGLSLFLTTFTDGYLNSQAASRAALASESTAWRHHGL